MGDRSNALCDDDDDCDSDSNSDEAGVREKMTMCVILENFCYNRTGSLNWANVALEFNCNAGIMTKLFPHSPGAPFLLL